MMLSTLFIQEERCGLVYRIMIPWGHEMPVAYCAGFLTINQAKDLCLWRYLTVQSNTLASCSGHTDIGIYILISSAFECEDVQIAPNNKASDVLRTCPVRILTRILSDLLLLAVFLCHPQKRPRQCLKLVHCRFHSVLSYLLFTNNPLIRRCFVGAKESVAKQITYEYLTLRCQVTI